MRLVPGERSWRWKEKWKKIGGCYPVSRRRKKLGAEVVDEEAALRVKDIESGLAREFIHKDRILFSVDSCFLISKAPLQ